MLVVERFRIKYMFVLTNIFFFRDKAKREEIEEILYKHSKLKVSEYMVNEI